MNQQAVDCMTMMMIMMMMIMMMIQRLPVSSCTAFAVMHHNDGLVVALAVEAQHGLEGIRLEGDVPGV